MNSIQVDTSNGCIHALRFGNGKELLIAIHGFGEGARIFAGIEEKLSDKFTTVAIDLPFHGQTQWRTPTFSKTDLLEIIDLILQKEKKTQFSLMGFSFGARLIQSMLPDLISSLDRVFLIAPDGIQTKGLRAAERTPLWLRQWLFRALQKPGWFVTLVKIGSKAGIIPTRMKHFVDKQLSRPSRINRVFGCWMSMNSFRIDHRLIQRIIQESGLPIDLYIGEKDPFIRVEDLRTVYGAISGVRLNVIKGKGHFILDAITVG